MKPIVDRLKKEYEGKVEIRVENTLSDSDARRIADEAGVEYVPTFIFYDRTGTKTDQVVGGMTEDQLRAKLEALLSE